MKDQAKKPLGLERVKKWLYAKGLEERSAGCVLCGSCYGHGPANPDEDVPGPKEKCPPYESNCLMCQELCGVRNDGYGPWDITVAMREELTLKDGPLEAHRPLFEGLREHDNPWAQPKTQRGHWADGLGLKKLGDATAATLLFAGCSADRPDGKAGAVALAKLMKS
ncbi:MAG: hypothetical protein HYW03_05840, partial [Deltaproteobacteria bacterium]|nr:hypothetical protein [Deltaproteobacteria bacterium]